MSDAHQHLKQKAGSKMREYLVIPSYLFVVLSRLVVHRSMVLAAPHIDYKLHGFALINALAIAMLLLVAQDPHLADRFLVIGKIHGRSFQESTSNLGSGTWNGILTLSALVFVVLIPFFSFTGTSACVGRRLVSQRLLPAKKSVHSQSASGSGLTYDRRNGSSQGISPDVSKHDRTRDHLPPGSRRWSLASGRTSPGG